MSDPDLSSSKKMNNVEPPKNMKDEEGDGELPGANKEMTKSAPKSFGKGEVLMEKNEGEGCDDFIPIQNGEDINPKRKFGLYETVDDILKLNLSNEKDDFNVFSLLCLKEGKDFRIGPRWPERKNYPHSVLGILPDLTEEEKCQPPRTKFHFENDFPIYLPIVRTRATKIEAKEFIKNRAAFEKSEKMKKLEWKIKRKGEERWILYRLNQEGKEEWEYGCNREDGLLDLLTKFPERSKVGVITLLGSEFPLFSLLTSPSLVSGSGTKMRFKEGGIKLTAWGLQQSDKTVHGDFKGDLTESVVQNVHSEGERIISKAKMIQKGVVLVDWKGNTFGDVDVLAGVKGGKTVHYVDWGRITTLINSKDLLQLPVRVIVIYDLGADRIVVARGYVEHKNLNPLKLRLVHMPEYRPGILKRVSKPSLMKSSGQFPKNLVKVFEFIKVQPLIKVGGKEFEVEETFARVSTEAEDIKFQVVSNGVLNCVILLGVHGFADKTLAVILGDKNGSTNVSEVEFAVFPKSVVDQDLVQDAEKKAAAFAESPKNDFRRVRRVRRRFVAHAIDYVGKKRNELTILPFSNTSSNSQEYIVDSGCEYGMILFEDRANWKYDKLILMNEIDESEDVHVKPEDLRVQIIPDSYKRVCEEDGKLNLQLGVCGFLDHLITIVVGSDISGKESRVLFFVKPPELVKVLFKGRIK